MPASHVMTGALATSWELADADTLVFHIRKGVRFHNKPPVNGREMTADDVAFSLERLFKTPTSYHYVAYPWKSNFESITAPDKWTAIIKCLPGRVGAIFDIVTCLSRIVPREMVEKYGDLSDWRNSCGTGAFMLVDYVSGSTWRLERNPNYWQKGPLHHENQLPYLDGIKCLIIPDKSTRLAAMRTAKIDWIGGLDGKIEWEDDGTLIRTSPELKYLRFFAGGTMAIHLRVETPPFTDIRVRRALAMAVDNEEIKDTYYGGTAEILTWPIGPIPDFMDMFTPLEELPESTRELFEYHPDKAKQLLAEAGYPDGFKTEVICTVADVDLLSIVKAYWEKIGVDLEIIVKEVAAYNSISVHKTHKQMIMAATNAGIPFKFVDSKAGASLNVAMIADPRVNEAWDFCAENYFEEAKKRQLCKEVTNTCLARAG